MKRLFALAAVLLCVHPATAAVRGGYTTSIASPTCNITKNIITDFGATGVAGADATPAFVGTGSFQDWAVNTWLPSHPNDVICLTDNGNAAYTFATFSGIPIFTGITNLVVNMPTSTFSNQLSLTTTGVAGTTLSFSSVPGIVSANLVGQPVIDLTTPSAVIGTVSSATSGTITFASISGVLNGDVISIAAGGYFLGTSGQSFTSAAGKLLQAVSVGSGSVTLQTTSDASAFSANTWAALTGVDVQGFGQPQNPEVWEYVFITGVNGSTGVVTFQSPTKFAYETTWPHYNFGDAFHINEGGPASLYAFPASWNVAQTYNIGTINQWGGGTLLNANGRSITFNNTKFLNWGVNFSQQQLLTLNNPDMSNIARLETDKMWDTVTINGGTVEGFFIQSGNTTSTLNLNGTHVTSGGISGSPGYLNFNNATLDVGLGIGAPVAGQTYTVSCTNSTFGSLAYGGINDTNIGNGSVTMSGGLLTVPSAVEAPVIWASPGAIAMLTDANTYGIPFTVTDLSGTGGPPPTNTLIQTSLAGGFPASFATHNVQVAAARSLNFSGCTGNNNILDVSQAPARNAKPLTYSNRIYTCTNNLATIKAANPGVPVIDINNPPANEPLLAWSLTSFTVAVSPADTGPNGTLDFRPIARFNNYPTLNSSGTVTGWGADIDLKVAGTRTYTGSTSTWSGGKPNDTLPTIASPSYMTGPMQAFLGTDITSEAAGQCPVVTITAQTN